MFEKNETIGCALAVAMPEDIDELTDEELEQVCGGQEVYYTVQPGDCLSVIAQHFGTTVKQLVLWNNIKNPNDISSFTNKELRVQ